MFYYLAQLRDFFFVFNVFKYITFRAAMAAVTTFILCMIFAPILTKFFRELKIRENAKRDDCPHLASFHNTKEGIPTMGGIFIVGSIVISVLLWADLSNHYILLTLFTCVYLAVLGAIDDYLKLTKKKGFRGLRPRMKFIWQVLLGCFVGSYIFFSPEVSTKVDIPFLKNVAWDIGWFYVPFVALIVIGTTNAVNLTDGMDGLAIGCVLIVSATLAILSYVTGHANFSEYLFIPFIPGAGELAVFCAAMMGASLGFLWFNSHPATIFMGDTGSLALGGSIGIIAVFIKKEILLVLLGGVFVMEALSVILQVASFKTTGKRIFKISPLHHHFQLSGWPESKIIIRFWILGVIFALLTLMTLKVR
ncbi:MAG: phospho-N-acetylmuramoyl-pentapeptide-transferase [Candidatus Omnitrophica bacterium]|nr:phospho-N-acetylmuramoyl-pentapeptide-transferase [Candidatus Omnitrophota bacterium]